MSTIFFIQLLQITFVGTDVCFLEVLGLEETTSHADAGYQTQVWLEVFIYCSLFSYTYYMQSILVFELCFILNFSQKAKSKHI